MEGKITSIQRQKNDKRRASIFLDEEFAFGVCDQTIEEFRLRKGDYIDRELFDKISDFDYFIEAKRIALSYLNHRARSEKEIRERLHREDIPEVIIGRVIDFLREMKLVDDEAWSRAFVNDKLIRKPISSKQLAFGLAQKGVDKETIAETIADLNAKQSDAERAMEAAEKRWPRIVRTESDPRKQQQKLYTFLAARGFDFNTVKDVYRKLAPGNDADDED
jgi:regulatory protein